MSEKTDTDQNVITLPNRFEDRTGYKQPPQHTRFKPGKSGNPRGRPVGARNKRLSDSVLNNAIKMAARREIQLQGGITMSMVDVVLTRLTNDAAKGNIRAAKLFLDLLHQAETLERQEWLEFLEVACRYKRDATAELDWCKANNHPIRNDMVPHPDDIIIDMDTGSVEYRGPLTPEAREEWRGLRSCAKFTEQRAREESERLQITTDKRERREIQLCLKTCEETKQKIFMMIGDWDR